MGKSRAATDRNNKKHKLGLKPKKKQQRQRQRQRQRRPSGPVQDHNDPALFGDGGGSARGGDFSAGLSTPDRIHRLLEPYTKDQLVGFLLDAATADAALLARIFAVANRDVSHRKIFVHGLGWDATRDALLQVFEPYGPVDDCNLVVDKATGRAKGYGFVLFRTRTGAVNALKQPQKNIKSRVAFCQLASVGPVPASSGADTSGRKVYISNVHADIAPDKLKAFFSQFGEIETGPFGFDMLTGKSRGFAIFIYKTQEGARRALEEPYKMFGGHQLHCQFATEHGQKGKAPALAPNPPAAAATLPGATPQPVLAAVAAAQNLALYNHNPVAYSVLLGQNPLLAAAALNPAAAAAALNPTVGLLASHAQTIGGGLGVGSGAPSLLGAYGSQALAGLQGLQSYQGSQLGQSSSMRPSGSHGGFP